MRNVLITMLMLKERMTRYESQCEQRGFKPGTKGMEYCKRELQETDQAQGAAFMNWGA